MRGSAIGGGCRGHTRAQLARHGPYSMTREGSGTSWVPDTTPHEGVFGKVGEWTTMSHGYLNLVYDQQGGSRGGNKTFVNGMVMGMAQRPLGDGTFGVRAMLSPDPFMGKSGYPLLLASEKPTDARAAIWQNWPDFERKATTLEAESRKLMSMSPDDLGALNAQVRAVSQTCRACHETYRSKRQKGELW